MDTPTFAKIVEGQLERIQEVLIAKGKEYANEDRLSNFKTGAALKGETIEQTLAGYMAKHTVSIYDMVMSGKEFPRDVWDEKITDHLNYLILLLACVVETDTEKNRPPLAFTADPVTHYPEKAPIIPFKQPSPAST